MLAREDGEVPVNSARDEHLFPFLCDVSGRRHVSPSDGTDGSDDVRSRGGSHPPTPTPQLLSLIKTVEKNPSDSGCRNLDFERVKGQRFALAPGETM